MPEEFDKIERAIEEAKGKVADSHTKPKKQDLMSTYELTENEIDELREDLKERLSPAGSIVLQIESVYLEQLDEALKATLGANKANARRMIRGGQRETLLNELQAKIEQRPAKELLEELAKNKPEELAANLLDCFGPSAEAARAAIGPFVTRDCDVADKLQPTISPVFSVADFPAPKNDPERVGAARKLAYVVAVGEDMRVLAAAETLRDRWADGQYEFCTTDLRNNLYCDMRSCDCGLLPEAERLALYAAVFGLTGDDLPGGARVNRGFFGMWDRFNDTVLRFLMSDGDTEANRRTKKEGILAATIDLQSNLAEHVSEVDLMRITDLYQQLRRELQLFNDPHVFNTVAPGCNPGWWEVVERLTGTPQDRRSVVASYELARRRDSIFEWVADFKFGVTPSNQLFRRMVDAVSALSGSAPWSPAIASQDRPALTGRSDELRPVNPQLEAARSTS